MKFSDLNRGIGGYAFISHSHKDIDKVRQIRNAMEEQGFEPLCFFLRCLSDDSEIETLIKREIDSREIFILADSRNSRESRWVREELRYINDTGRKADRVLHLDDDYLDEELQWMMNSMRAFISYSKKDVNAARALRDELIRRDLKIYMDETDLAPGDDWAASISKAIEFASFYGCYVILVSANSIQSKIVIDELRYAYDQNTRIIPVIMGDPALTPMLQGYLSRFPCVRISSDPFQTEIEKVASIVGNVLLRKYMHE